MYSCAISHRLDDFCNLKRKFMQVDIYTKDPGVTRNLVKFPNGLDNSW